MCDESCVKLCGGSEETSSCPFAYSDNSEIAQGYGCLPTPYEILNMRVNHGKTWACHESPTKPCVGAINHLIANGLPWKVEDKELLTESVDWSMYIT